MKKTFATLFYWTLSPVHYPVKFIHNKIVKLEPKHRRIAHIVLGSSIAYGGVWISKTIHISIESLHLLPDYLGYMFHGIGVIPVVHELFKWIGYEEHPIDFNQLKKDIINQIYETQCEIVEVSSGVFKRICNIPSENEQN